MSAFMCLYAPTMLGFIYEMLTKQQIPVWYDAILSSMTALDTVVQPLLFFYFVPKYQTAVFGRVIVKQRADKLIQESETTANSKSGQ